MKRATLLRLTDFVSFVALISLISTGTTLKFLLPARSGAASLLGLTRHQWGDVHYYLSVAFLVLMSLHLWTHRQFIKSLVIGKASTEHTYRLLLGLIALLVLLLLLVGPWLIPVDHSVSGLHRRHG